ncbi:hypothetical protein CONPUDRAFT_166426 [Coniophora puteana RWD-64-598 SS2]|uniref:F-box domain-containing protein n=1 Tax=Coniophora puteana (strain RWD-64-598) TaxID=741705 RepID=A0A5M3MKW4_CONPW|nr:uncharacterized protein CONPUDRAFT_166426 [Coniophora puteana RWD-64-598 SS2]EIW79706.1 hypothetical protein CONPUDRAFT_166426 [Coniophora puteana RWD-64-598 SS2]
MDHERLYFRGKRRPSVVAEAPISDQAPFFASKRLGLIDNAPTSRAKLKVPSNLSLSVIVCTSRDNIGNTPIYEPNDDSAHWRTTALSTASLWVMFSYCHLACCRCYRWGSEVLARSGMTAPLYVHADPTQVRVETAAYSAMVKNMGRTRALHLQGGSNSYLEGLMASAASAPALEKVCIGHHTTEISTFPFHRQCPRLNELRLRARVENFDWGSLYHFSQLRTLEIHDTIDDFAHGFPGVVRAIDGMRALENLDLQLEVPGFDPRCERNFCASLPSLKRFFLSANADVCLGLLSCLRFDRTRVNLSLNVLDDEEDLTTDVLRRLVALCQAEDDPDDTQPRASPHGPFFNLDGGDCSFSIESDYDAVCLCFKYIPASDNRPSLELNCWALMDQAGALFASFAAVLPVASATSLAVGGCARAANWPKTLHDVFRHLPALQKFKLINTSREGSRAVFASLWPRDDGTLPAPMLRKIAVGGSWNDRECPSLEALRDCIVARRAQGQGSCQIRRIVCGSNCELVAHEVGCLRDLGIHVCWMPHLFL